MWVQGEAALIADSLDDVDILAAAGKLLRYKMSYKENRREGFYYFNVLEQLQS